MVWGPVPILWNKGNRRWPLLNNWLDNLFPEFFEEPPLFLFEHVVCWFWALRWLRCSDSGMDTGHLEGYTCRNAEDSSYGKGKLTRGMKVRRSSLSTSSWSRRRSQTTTKCEKSVVTFRLGDSFQDCSRSVGTKRMSGFYAFRGSPCLAVRVRHRWRGCPWRIQQPSRLTIHHCCRGQCHPSVLGFVEDAVLSRVCIDLERLKSLRDRELGFIIFKMTCRGQVNRLWPCITGSFCILRLWC